MLQYPGFNPILVEEYYLLKARQLKVFLIKMLYPFIRSPKFN